MMYLETLRDRLIVMRKWLGDPLCPSALYGKSILQPPITYLKEECGRREVGVDKGFDLGLAGTIGELGKCGEEET